MRRAECARRIVAAGLMAFQVTACGSPRRVPTGLAPGDVVRVTIRGDGTMKGRAVAMQSDTLVLETERERAFVTADSVARIEVRSGTHGNAGLGFLIGAVVGGAGAAGAFAAGGSGNDTFEPGFFALVGGFLGFLFGGAVGAGLGAAVRSDTWVEVSQDALAKGWTYAVDSVPSGDPEPRDVIATVPPPDPALRLSLAPRARVVQPGATVVELQSAWVSADSVGGRTVPDTAAVSIARRDIARVLAPRGRHGHAALGFGLGLAAGLAGGLLVGSLFDDAGAHSGGVGALIGAPVGAVIGLVAGGMVRSDNWVDVDLEAVMQGRGVR